MRESARQVAAWRILRPKPVRHVLIRPSGRDAWAWRVASGPSGHIPRNLGTIKPARLARQGEKQDRSPGGVIRARVRLDTHFHLLWWTLYTAAWSWHTGVSVGCCCYCYCYYLPARVGHEGCKCVRVRRVLYEAESIKDGSSPTAPAPRIGSEKKKPRERETLAARTSIWTWSGVSLLAFTRVLGAYCGPMFDPARFRHAMSL